MAGLQGWILHKPQLAVPARIKATTAGLSCPALPRVPGPAPQNNPSTPNQPQQPQTAPRWGGFGDMQLFQQSAGDGSPPVPTSPGVSKDGLDSPLRANGSDQKSFVRPAGWPGAPHGNTRGIKCKFWLLDSSFVEHSGLEQGEAHPAAGTCIPVDVASETWGWAEEREAAVVTPAWIHPG